MYFVVLFRFLRTCIQINLYYCPQLNFLFMFVCLLRFVSHSLLAFSFSLRLRFSLSVCFLVVDNMAGRGTTNIYFGQFPAVVPLGEKLPKAAPVDEPAPGHETLVPLIVVVHAEAPEAPLVEELPADSVEDAGVAGSRENIILTVPAHVVHPDNVVADDAPGAADHDDVPEDFHDEDESAVHFTEEDLLEARERAELSLLARIFWDEPRELRVVENSYVQVWKCGRVRIFDVGSGLYQFIFPSVAKRDWVLENQPWFFQRSIIHFTDNMVPTEELFHSLQFMLI
ncbi:hypothetical protein LINPERPRIM_LOCUS26579 [Linum perenne]